MDTAWNTTWRDTKTSMDQSGLRAADTAINGATNMFTGSAARPPEWLKQRYGVDIDVEVEDTIKELALDRLPDDALGKRSRQIMEAANSLGYDWAPLMKFMRPSHTARFDCGAKCMLGCRCGAKWTANEYVDDAVAAGCELMTRARVDDLIIEDAVDVTFRSTVYLEGDISINASGNVTEQGIISSNLHRLGDHDCA